MPISNKDKEDVSPYVGHNGNCEQWFPRIFISNLFQLNTVRDCCKQRLKISL